MTTTEPRKRRRPRRPKVTTKTRPTWGEVVMTRELTALIDSARRMKDQTDARGMRRTATELRQLIRTLDAARTCLVQEGEAYLAEAEAFRIAAERQLLDIAIRVGGLDG